MFNVATDLSVHRNCRPLAQSRSQDSKKGGGGAFFEVWFNRERTLPQFSFVFDWIEANSERFSAQIKWSPKKKKKKGRCSWTLILHFGEVISVFLEQNQPQNWEKHAILHTFQANGGLYHHLPPPPSYATALAPGTVAALFESFRNLNCTWTTAILELQ